MASQNIPAMAYGLRYEYGVFRQEIDHGVQVEKPYDWQHKGHPWEIVRPEYNCEIQFYGKSQKAVSPANPLAGAWTNTEKVIAVPYDVPITGYKNRTVNTLRLWVSRASEEFLPDYANHGDYVRACEEKSRSGTLTKILFPEEDVLRATELRLKQQYFLVSAALSDILRRYKQHNDDILKLPERVVIQLSGSSCALAVAELMRILVDVENIPWEKAWNTVINVFTYTSHAVAKEGLESWPVYLLTQVLPRHMDIIYEINQQYLDEVRKRFGNREDLIREISLIQEGEMKRVRLASLAMVGSFYVNGVSAPQTQALASKVFPEFNAVSPEKFRNETNGISHRRWMLSANRPMADLITESIGDSWIRNPERLVGLKRFAKDGAFLTRFAEIRMTAKKNLSDYIKKYHGVDVDPQAMFDVQCKKIHQYKRQVLHVLHIFSRYIRVKNGETLPVKRVHVFAGKAAPSDQLAKQIIKLINAVAYIVNNDPAVAGKMTVVFLPDYDVSLAERIVPATDLSEQIATPGQEACGTGTMKFALNGALTIASKCGSNIELIEQVGEENVFVFGKDVSELPAFNRYQPFDLIAADKHLSALFAVLEEGLRRLPHNGLSINPLLSTLKDSDRYFVLLDFNDYILKQTAADQLFVNKQEWLGKGVQSIAQSGWFSIDRAVSEYARDIWRIGP